MQFKSKIFLVLNKHNAMETYGGWRRQCSSRHSSLRH